MATATRQLIAGTTSASAAARASLLVLRPAATTTIVPGRMAFAAAARECRRRNLSTASARSSARGRPSVLLALAPKMAARPGGGGGGGGGQGGLGTPPCGRRHESSSAGSGDTKIWSFEEVRDLTSSSSSSPTKITIIDVREPHELSSTGRIPGAINVPVKSAPDSWHVPEDEFEHAHGFPRPAKGAEVLFYCKAGVRSRAAAGLARDAGFTAVGEYPGSWDEWVAKGGKVQR